MKKSWINPEEIYLADHLNPRQLNQGFIESLVESMQDQGFLPQYPVKVFEAAPLTCIETELPYACVSGMHRTTSAQLAKLDQILCEVHTGEDDAFIEMMMISNFEYDPAQNSEIGQVFSQREKRNACKRLLFIPKFLKMTNSALAETWHTPETNIRRWRKEVASSIDEGVPTQLRVMGVSPERLPELQEILSSRQREDADGNIVPIRTAPKEMTDDEKEKYWSEIRTDAGWHNNGWLEKHGIKDFDYVRKYLSKKHGIADDYRMYKELTTHQLRDIHGAILSDDPELIAGCKEAGKEREAIESAREELREACGSVKKWLLSEFVQGNEYSQAYKECQKAFTDAARQFGYGDYHVESYDFPGGKNLAEIFRSQITLVLTVQNDIDLNDMGNRAEWVEEFCQKMEKNITAKRQKLEKNWKSAQKALLQSFEEYPRNISIGSLCYALEDEFYEKSGTYLRLLCLKEPSDRVHNDTLKSQTKYFKQAAKDLKEDAKWVRAIVEEPEKDSELVTPAGMPKTVEEVLPGGKVLGIKLVCSDHRHYWFEDDSSTPTAVPLSDVPEEILVRLLMLTKDIDLLGTAAQELVAALNEVSLPDSTMIYALEKACTHYSCGWEELLMLTNLFPNRFDANDAKTFREKMVAPHVNAWIQTLQSMKRDVETGENWMSGIKM